MCNLANDVPQVWIHKELLELHNSLYNRLSIGMLQHSRVATDGSDRN
jgi:hypothetical protein